MRSRRQQRASSAIAPGPQGWPPVDLVIPSFNEDPALLEACCRSAAFQYYPGRLRVWLVDDGSSNRAALVTVHERCRSRGVNVRLLDHNLGKRAAQDEAVRRGSGELVVLMDSDTVLAPDAVRHAAARFRDEEVGAVSGRIGVLNAPTAQPPGRAVAEVPEPDVRRRPLHQRRRPAPDQPGPGHRPPGPVRAEGDCQYLGAPVAPPVPRQQLRWSRNFYRELRWTVGAIRFRHPYLALDVLARGLLPLLLGAAIGLLASEGLLGGWELLAADLVMFLAICCTGRCTWPCWSPSGCGALVTLASTRWETR